MEVLFSYACVYLFEAIILWQYTSCLFDSKYKKWKEGAFLWGLYTVLLFLSFQKKPWLNTLSFLLVNFQFIAIMYHIKWYSALFHAAITTIIMGMSELASFGIISKVIVDILNKNQIPNDFIFYGILSKTIYFFIMYLLSHSFQKKNKAGSQGDRVSLLLSFVPFSTLCVMLILFSISIAIDLSSLHYWLISICAILLLGINLIVFFINSYNQKKSMEFTKLQLLLQKEHDDSMYYESLLKKNEDQNILIHDMKKHLNSIALLNESQDFEKIDSYIHSLLHSSTLRESAQICDHKLLNAILSNYIRKADQENISFRADIRSGTTHFLEDNDLTSLFCNLLDNALEAASKMTESFVELNVYHKAQTAFTVLTMINSCRVNPFDRATNQLITHKPDKMRHGFGMKSVQRIVEKYHGDMKLYYDQETYTFHTIITFRDEKSMLR